MAQKNKELEELNKKCDEYLTGWKRERADFLNYKKEEMERISQLIKYANEELVLKLLPILDNFCLAEQHVQDPGITQIKKQLEDLLKKEGIEHIEVLNKKFDPSTMEAIEQTDKMDRDPTSIQSGIVVEEAQRGYTMHGKLLRPARVKISK